MAILVLVNSVFVERQLNALRRIAPDLEIHTDPDNCPAERIEVLYGFRLPRGLAARFPNLKLIASSGAGVDGVLTADLPAHVQVTRAVDPLQAQRLAQYAVYHVLRIQRDMAFFENLQRERKCMRPDAPQETDWTVGIMGLGAIGLKLAESLRTLGYPVLGWSRTRHSHAGIETFVGQEELPAFLARTRILVLLLPATPATQGLIDAKVFAGLPRGAHLIQIARGGIVVEEAMMEALDGGRLDSAVLDVFSREPLPADSPLWTHPKVTVTPHVAGEPRAEWIAAQFNENYRRLLKGEPLENAVSREAGY